ncbi:MULTISPECIES: hypothetical protein [Streptomyces]|uniref:Uncharacterized protein n=2 Tax=Streptomyces TaxID=1883 RepID=A0A646KT80_STRJU|nr:MULTISPECIES: hypothetical protein [Streptomyces]MQS38409.1 hypothetical protein [Streptomyces katsurahamanus]MQT05247.1 hypothetical protein [Streptomyces jumonjinensis]
MTPEPAPLVSGPMSDQMAWGLIYGLALDIAERHGATVPDQARAVGPYAFHEAVQSVEDGWCLLWNGKPA